MISTDLLSVFPSSAPSALNLYIVIHDYPTLGALKHVCFYLRHYGYFLEHSKNLRC